MIKFKKSEMLFVIIIGQSLFKMPYTIHTAIPKVRMANILSEISFTFLVFQTFKICGTVEIVIQAPANKPIISM